MRWRYMVGDVTFSIGVKIRLHDDQNDFRRNDEVSYVLICHRGWETPSCDRKKSIDQERSRLNYDD